MHISELQRNWDEFGRTNPLWAILTINPKWDPADFFRTGVEDIEHVFHCLDSLGISVLKGRALDFGCGVGRLTQALCRRFEECYGIDIAPSMLELARQYNQYGHRCKYYLNETNALPAFQSESFDFVYSKIVLQHMLPQYSMNYITEFLRILRPGGALVFQIPEERNSAQRLDGAALAEILPEPAFRASIRPELSSFVASQASCVELAVTVKNLSSATWPAAQEASSCPIGLGNHWRNDKGKLLAMDDGRTALDQNLKPNDERQLTLVVNTPEEPGNYILELDMVQDLVAWFGDKGSEVAKIPVQIVQNQTLSTDAGPKVRPKMEMYGVPGAKVLETIARGGGHVVDVQPDFTAGDWTSFLYYVTKK
jgi:2-polyprenyl-3-methyl-5-hydroxy-6-metoxy-1,4-benzoquinol methylase